MNALGRSHNLAARAGRWSARHWKTATFGWLGLVAVVTVLGAVVGTTELSDADGMSVESARAQRIVDAAGFPAGATEVVLVQSATADARSPAFRRAVASVEAALAATPGVRDVRSPFSRGNDDRISQSSF